jgi:hypothetical protein
VHTTAFYGQPLVSWTPALGAEVYEVQWSKTQYPFTPQPAPAGTLGILTSSTSVVLPVTPGTWWYRVRGFDYSLPTGAQQMSWSDPAKLVVAPPKFKLVGGSTSAAPTKPAAATAASAGLRTVSGAGFTIGIPTAWTRGPGSQFNYDDPAKSVAVHEQKTWGRGSMSLTQWASYLKTKAKPLSTTSAVVTLSAAAAAVRLDFGPAGKPTAIEYFVDAGSSSYMFAFTGSASPLVAERPIISKMMASLRLTS